MMMMMIIIIINITINVRASYNNRANVRNGNMIFGGTVGADSGVPEVGGGGGWEVSTPTPRNSEVWQNRADLPVPWKIHP
jgi:hypothetical protein